MIEKVFGSNVLVEPKEVEEQTEFGLILPTAKGQKKQIAEVIAVGAGHVLEDGTRVPLEAEVGDLVVYNKFAGMQISDEGHDYLLLNERDLLVKVGNVK